MNLKEHLLNRILDSLEEFNLSYEIIDRVEDYLSGEMAEEEFLSKLPKIDFSKGDYPKTRKVVHSIEKHKDNEYLRKFINILYEMGEERTLDLFGYYYLSNSRIENWTKIGIEKYKIYSIYICKNFNKYNHVDHDYLKPLYELCKNDPKEAKKTIKILDKDGALDAYMVILSVYCRTQTERNMGLLNKCIKLITESKEEKEFIEESIAFIEKVMLRSIENMYDNRLPEDFINTIISFIKGNEEIKSNEALILINNIKSYKYDEEVFKFLVGMSMLNMENSKILNRYVKFFAQVDFKYTLSLAYKIMPIKTFYCDTVYDLDKTLDIDTKYYILWYAEKFGNEKFGQELLEKKFKQNQRAFEEAAKLTHSYTSNFLMSFFLQGKEKEKYVEQIINNSIVYIIKEVIALENISDKQYSIMEDFLNGKTPFNECRNEIYLIEEGVKEEYYYYYYGRKGEQFINTLNLLCKCNKKDLYNRILILLGAASNRNALRIMLIISKKNKVQILENMFALFEEYDLSIEKQMKMLDCILVTHEIFKGSKHVLDKIVEKLIVKNEEEFSKNFKSLSSEGRVNMLQCIFSNKNEERAKILINNFGDSSKVVKETIVELFNDSIEFYPLVKEKLSSTKQSERETSIMVLKEFKEFKKASEDVKKSIEEDLKEALEKEKSQKIRILLMKSLNIEEEQEELSESDFVSNILKGNKKRTLEWLQVENLYKVKNIESKEYCGEDYLKAILLCYSSTGTISISSDGNKLAEKLDKHDLEFFANEVFDKWIEKGAEAKKKWILAFASIYGGNSIVLKLNSNINEWAKNSRGAIAGEAVRALALNGSSSALLIVDGISRKFKYKQVKTAAGDALDFAAEQMGMEREELSDKIVPALGFDKNGERVFDYGTRKFKVVLTPNLEIEIYDEKEKKLKNLPSPGKKDDEVMAKESHKEFKEFKKQLKMTVGIQATRLDLALSSERKWTKPSWINLFVENPLMHQFAIGLVWGTYKKGEIEETFRYMEDGTFNTKDEDEFEIGEECEIGLVHPLELSNNDLNEWKEQLENYEIIQPIEQLNRKIFIVTEEEKTMKACERFGGKIINGLSLVGKMLAQGWYRGSVEDAGFYESFYKENNELGIRAELTFEGLPVGYENEDTTIYVLEFYSSTALKGKSYITDKEKNKHLLPLSKVSKKFFSEILYQVDKALSTSTEKDEDWKINKR